jgi:putative ABC transport system permease protein
LKALAGRSDGVLLSRHFQIDAGVRLGDSIQFTDELGNVVRASVVGFIDFWPGFSSVQRVEVYDQVTELRQPFIVANIGHLQSQRGVQPYQIWMRTNTDSNLFFRDFIEENRLNIVEFNDTNAALIESRSDPILQGTNGVLTVGFIITLLICFTGFLMYWILSLRSRVLQFGIFRAMGMGMRNLLSLLVNEQIFITFTSIALGALVGEISARLFVPLIQISYTAADQVIPLMVVNELQDYANLYTVVGIMVIICLIILGGYISRIKIAQALKLGED